MSFRSVLGVLLLTFFSAAPLFADNSHPCQDDRRKYCGDVKPGAGRIAKCMKDNEANLSPECKAAWDKMKKRLKNFKAACEGDIHEYCKDVKPGAGRIIRCLKQHEADLDPLCKEALPKRSK